MQVDKNKCVGCGGRCGICSARAIQLKDGKAEIDECKCAICHECM